MKKLIVCSLLVCLMSLTTLARVSTVGWEISWYSDFIRIHVEATEPWVAIASYDDGSWEVVGGPFDENVTTFTIPMPFEDYNNEPWYYAAPAKILKSPDNGNHQGWYNKKHKHY